MAQWDVLHGIMMFRLGLMCPRTHIRLGWDTNAAAATMAIDKAKNDGLMADYDVE